MGLLGGLRWNPGGRFWAADCPTPHPEAQHGRLYAYRADPGDAIDAVAAQQARACWWVVTENSDPAPVECVEIIYHPASKVALRPAAEVEIVTQTHAGLAMVFHLPDGVPWAGAGAAELRRLIAWAEEARTGLYVSLQHTTRGRCQVGVTVDFPEQWASLDELALSLSGGDMCCGQLTAIDRETTEEHSSVELLAIALVELHNLNRTAEHRAAEMEAANG